MLHFIKAKLPSFKDSAFGWDGLTTFIFSNFLMFLSLGLFFLYLLLRVIQVAMITKTVISKKTDLLNRDRIVLIAGLCLHHNQLTEEFKHRLDRAIALEQDNPDTATTNSRIIILGGLTGDNQISEARAGADYLMTHGVSETNIILEDQSRHTLENLQHARTLLLTTCAARQQLPENMIIISSRYHLYRALTLAKGLKMTLKPIAAEPSMIFSLSVLFRVMKEAYYLHWYWSGKLWVFITANHKSQAKIS